MKNYLFRILLFVLALPLFFACSTSRDFTAFSSNTGGYHNKPNTRKATPEAAPVTPANEAEMPVALPAEANATGAEIATPAVELGSVSSRLQQAAAEANVQAKASERSEAKKLNFAEKLVLKKALKAVEKATSGKDLKGKKPTEITKPALDQNLKLGIIFLLLALIASLIWYLLAVILLIVALVFFLLWALTL